MDAPPSALGSPPHDRLPPLPSGRPSPGRVGGPAPTSPVENGSCASRKGVADRIWEDLVLALVGDQFAGVAPPHEDEWPEICGCTISVRQSEDILSVWNRIDEPKLRERIRCVKSGCLVHSALTSIWHVTLAYNRDRIRVVLHLPPSTIMGVQIKQRSVGSFSIFPLFSETDT